MRAPAAEVMRPLGRAAAPSPPGSPIEHQKQRLRIAFRGIEANRRMINAFVVSMLAVMETRLTEPSEQDLVSGLQETWSERLSMLDSDIADARYAANGGEQ